MNEWKWKLRKFPWIPATVRTPIVGIRVCRYQLLEESLISWIESWIYLFVRGEGRKGISLACYSERENNCSFGFIPCRGEKVVSLGVMSFSVVFYCRGLSRCLSKHVLLSCSSLYVSFGRKGDPSTPPPHPLMSFTPKPSATIFLSPALNFNCYCPPNPHSFLLYAHPLF